MPLYEYRCPECGHDFESQRKMSEPNPDCPECGHKDVEKLVSASSFALRGGGWYKDGYGSAGGSGSAGGASGPKKSEGTKPAAEKSDTKKKSDGAASS